MGSVLLGMKTETKAPCRPLRKERYFQPLDGNPMAKDARQPKFWMAWALLSFMRRTAQVPINRKELDQSQRFFMLLPLIHSEEMFDHEMAYHFLELYLKEHPGLADIKKFWKDHTNAIKKFNRYPHRNKILGRESTKAEIEFLKGPNSSW